MLVEAGNEDDQRQRQFRRQRLEGFESVQTRHLDVQEYKIRRYSLDLRHRLESILSFTDYLNAFVIAQKPTQTHSGVGFVIDDQRTQFVHASPAIGIKIGAREPARSWLSKEKRAAPW